MLNMILLFIGTTEIIVIGAVALLIFGGKKLPELMRGLGKGVKEFKDGMHDVNNLPPRNRVPVSNKLMTNRRGKRLTHEH